MLDNFVSYPVKKHRKELVTPVYRIINLVIYHSRVTETIKLVSALLSNFGLIFIDLT